MSEKKSGRLVNPIWIKVISTDEAILPKYQTDASVGCDLHSVEELTLKPGKRSLISTGLKLELPIGIGAYVCSRSGLAVKHGVAVLNSPGVIDSDYRGEVKVILQNFGDEDFHISKGDRIAQLLFFSSVQAIFQEAKELSQTNRGESGFGSTGISST